MPSLSLRKTVHALFGLLCVVLAGLVVLLAQENRALKHEKSVVRNDPAGITLQKGDKLGIETLHDAAGNDVELGFGDERETLVFVFSTDCPACRTAMPIWNGLLAKSSQNAPRVLGIQVNPLELPSPGETPEPAFPVFGVTHFESLEWLRAKVPMVPTTLLVNRSGVVQSVWTGVLSETDQQELERILNL